MKVDNPVLAVISGPVAFLLLEDCGFYYVPCEEMPDCDCGHLHLVPSIEFLLDSEYLTDAEVEVLKPRVDLARSKSDSGMAARELAIQIHEVLDARQLDEAEQWQESNGLFLEEDGPPPPKAPFRPN